ncbi:MAG: hypothetical protein PHI97_11140 [Desulfobulbus sp.]|nr:hypothetical protein [Desulfobulbus sp.]
MVPNVSARTYRPRQMAAFQEARRVKNGFQIRLPNSVRRFLAVTCLAALVAGLLITQYFYGQMMDMRTQAEQLRGLHAQMYNQSVELRAHRAQLSSKDHIVALASVKLDLYEPGQRQVRRM